MSISSLSHHVSCKRFENHVVWIKGNPVCAGCIAAYSAAFFLAFSVTILLASGIILTPYIWWFWPIYIVMVFPSVIRYLFDDIGLKTRLFVRSGTGGAFSLFFICLFYATVSLELVQVLMIIPAIIPLFAMIILHASKYVDCGDCEYLQSDECDHEAKQSFLGFIEHGDEDIQIALKIDEESSVSEDKE